MKKLLLTAFLSFVFVGFVNDAYGLASSKHRSRVAPAAAAPAPVAAPKAAPAPARKPTPVVKPPVGPKPMPVPVPVPIAAPPAPTKDDPRDVAKHPIQFCFNAIDTNNKAKNKPIRICLEAKDDQGKIKAIDLRSDSTDPTKKAPAPTADTPVDNAKNPAEFCYDAINSKAPVTNPIHNTPVTICLKVTDKKGKIETNVTMGAAKKS